MPSIWAGSTIKTQKVFGTLNLEWAGKPLNCLGSIRSYALIGVSLISLCGVAHGRGETPPDVPLPVEEMQDPLVEFADEQADVSDENSASEIESSESAESAEAAGDVVPDYALQKMQYEVYASGMHLVSADMTIDFTQNGRYGMMFNAYTHGLLGKLAPWTGSFESKGWALEDLNRIPEIHESISTWRDEREVKTYRYDQEKGFLDITTTYVGKKPRTRVPDEALTVGTTDALTATLKVMERVSDGNPCEGKTEVFDGKRRFELIYHHKGYVDLKKSRYNAYGGLAAECEVEVVPVAGAWYKKPRGWLSIQEQGRDRGMMPTVWFAQLQENALVVPVRVRVKTAYGTMFMHLTHYEGGETVLSLK